MKELYRTDGEDAFHKGNVREIYEIGDEHLVIIATDRITLYGRKFPNPIPGKGVYLNRLSHFWLDFLRIKDHRASFSEISEVEMKDFWEMEEELQDRMMLVKKAEPFEVDVIVRGRLFGSAWEEYSKKGSVGGHHFPKGLKKGDVIPGGPILTARDRMYDKNITLGDAGDVVGAAWPVLRVMAFDIYKRAARHCEKKGIVLADTRLQFGMVNGEITLIDEVITPETSRFWMKGSPLFYSFDKQYLRDWIVGTDWKSEDDLPAIPEDVVEKTLLKYKTLYSLLTS